MKEPFVQRIKLLSLIVLWFMMAGPAKADVCIAYRTDSPQLNFAVSRLGQALRQAGQTPVLTDLAGLGEADILIVADEQEAIFVPGPALESAVSPRIEPEGFQIARKRSTNKTVVCVIARDGPEANPAMNLHTQTCRDLNFWQRFLDMMAQNRFNVLSLWNLHPFTYMIRPDGFGEACPFSDKELARWQRFWRRLFGMAKQRGIETYVVNWNIVVSPEFAKAHGLKERNDTSDIVRRYTRQCARQVIDEYDELTGLGVTLADWMNNMTPKEREDWIQDTFVEGMKQARRPAKFIHRSVLAGSPLEMRRVIDQANFPDPVWVEVKFNWSHGHSTPTLAITHDYSSGQIDERFWKPAPENYRIAWMIRNEDFFVL
ncbi:MAG: hypothetical protein ACYTEK_26315, partial [Planctomycetota bacterium]